MIQHVYCCYFREVERMELLTVYETAQMLKVTPITVRRYIAAGRLAAVKVGKGVRVRKEAIDQLVEPVDLTRPKRKPPLRRGKLFTKRDALFNIIGIAEGPADDVTDVSSNKMKYLAEAYAAKTE